MRFDPIGFLAHVLVFRETPAKTVHANLALADELDGRGLVLLAGALRQEVNGSGIGFDPRFR